MKDLFCVAQLVPRFDTLDKLDEHTVRNISFTRGEIAWVTAEAMYDARRRGELPEICQRRPHHG